MFEIALVVPNLEEAMAQYHQAFGYTFSPILEGHLALQDASGAESKAPLRMVVSRDLSPQLELVEAQPGTVLDAPGGTALHHLGFYVDDLGGESERLQSLGFAFDCAGTAFGEAPDGWVYLRMADNTIIELVDRERAPLRRMLTDGNMPDSPLANRLIPISDELAGRTAD